MTTATLAYLPLAAGSAIASAAGRAGMWGLARFARAPLTYTGIFALVGFSLMAGSNALYFQNMRHPAPFFAPAIDDVVPVAPKPVVPAVRLKSRPASDVVETTGSLPSQMASPDQVPVEPVGNAEVFEVQKKLLAFKLFEGTVDGYYGPRTASAIRAFELRVGLTPQGALTRDVVDLILRTPVIDPQPVPEQQPVAEPQIQQAVVTPQAVVERPVTAIQPQVTAIRPQVAATKTPLGRVLPETPEEALEIVVDTAAETIDTIVAAVEKAIEPDQVAAKKPAAKPAVTAALEPAPEPQVSVKPLQLAAIQPLPEKPAEAVPATAVVAMPVALLPSEANPPAPAATASVPSGTDPQLVAKAQRGLASLGFLHGEIDGVAGEATAKAIRNFEVYYNYKVTGQITPELIDLLTAAGAVI